MAENTKKTTLKKYGKIVPVAVAGFVAVSAGTMDAQAEELDINTTDVTPGEEQQAEAAEISTTIDSATKSEDSLKVNVGVDGDEVTDDGELNWVETSGDPNSSSDTVTNDDGSTTTTTTTTTDSKVEIDGEVSDDAVTHEDEDKEEEVQDVIKDQTDISSAFKEQYGKENVTVEPTDPQYSDDGKTVTESYKVTVTESEVADKHLTNDELNVILKAEGLTPVEGKPGTYTDETGATVTVKVTDDNSEETTTTKWTITVSKTTTTVSDSEDVASRPVENITDTTSSEAGTADSAETDSLSVEEILAAAKNGTGEFANATVETNGNGDITRITADNGNKTYEFTYTVETETGEKVNISNWTADQIMALLPADKYEKNANGEIVDKAGNVLTFTAENLKQYGVKVSVKLTDKQGSESDSKPYGDTSATDAKTAAKSKAIQDAIEKALEAQGTEINGTATDNEDGTWTVTGKDGKEYTFTITVDAETGEPKAWTPTEDIKGYVPGSGLQYTVTGSAVVKDGEVVWGETEDYDEIKLTLNGKIDTTSKLFEGMDSVEISEDGTTVTARVTNEDGSVTTKTYTFTYGVALTNEEKAQFIAGKVVDGTIDPNSLDLTKTTWTVQETTVKTETDDNFEDTVITSDGVTWDAEKEVYTFTDKDSGETITLEKGEDGKYTRDDGNGTVYILEEEDVPLADADDATIQAMIAKKYELAEGTKVGINAKKQTATFTKDGAEVTVSYADLKTLTVKKTVTEKENLATSGSTGVADMLSKITNIVKNAGQNEKFYIMVDGKEYQLSFDKETERLVDSEGKAVTQDMLTGWVSTVINFKDLSGDELVEYLQGLEENNVAHGKVYHLMDHVDLVVEGKITVSNDKDPVDCIVLHDGLSYKWSNDAETLVDQDGAEIAGTLRDTVHYDWFSGQYEYRHDITKQVWVSKPEANKSYYEVSGTVAYGEYQTIKREYYIGWIPQSNDEYNNAAAEALKKRQETHKDAVMVKVDGEWRIYDNSAPLLAYGFMDDDSNCCEAADLGGYDLKLKNLTLVDGTVTATAGKVNQYSIALTKKTETTDDNFASGSSLTLTGETTKTTTTQPGENGSDFSGSYEITKDLGNMNVKGSDTADYYTYQTYETTTAEGSASGTRYDGQLDYTYEVVGEPEVKVTEKTVEKDRVVDVTLEKTTEKTEETTTPAPAPTDPGTNPGPGTTPDPDPNPGTNPGPGTTPDPEPTDIADEDVPLTEMPDGEIPLSETPEDVEIPDDDVPLTEIPEEDVPKTGDASMSWFLAAIASALGLAGLTIADRKRKSEDAE